MDNKITTKNFILWIMGPTASGKTTIARYILEEIRQMGRLAILYDGDEIRDFIGPCLGFKREDRLRVVKTLVHLANKAMVSGLDVIVSALTANPDARAYVKKNTKNLILACLDCDIATCINRDPKGLNKRARSGDIDTLIGYNTEYIPIGNPDILINTQSKTVEKCVQEFMDCLRKGALTG